MKLQRWKALRRGAAFFFTLCLAVGLAGCDGAAPGALFDTAQSDAGASGAASSAAPASSAASAQGAFGDYDAIRPVADITIQGPQMLLTDGALRYYTMQKDGLWGVLRADGAEVLPCLAPEPVSYCQMQHWMWNAPISWEEIDDWNAKLAASGDGETGCAHGLVQGYYAIVPTDSSQPRVLYYAYSEGSAGVETATAEQFARQGGVLPVLLCIWQENALVGGLVPVASDNRWTLADESGRAVTTTEQWDAVGWFGKEPLAPTCKNGKWAYVDKTGKAVTEYVYDSTWSGWRADAPNLAYDLHDGVAPVLKNGKWGVIDATGKEIVPCEYDGAAPADGGVLLLENGVWTLEKLPKA